MIRARASVSRVYGLSVRGEISTRIPPKMSHAATISLLLLSMLTTSGAASAQTTGALGPSSGKDEVSPGGCTPIGLTASGEVVFPFTCKAFLEQRRGPIEAPKPAATAEQPAPAAKEEAPAASGPAQAVVAGKNEPVIRAAETTSSTSTIDPRLPPEARKKRARRANELAKTAPSR
jgi:hypothetical protein